MGCIWWAILIPVVDMILLSRMGKALGAGTILIWMAAAGILGYAAIRTRGFTARAGGSPLGPLERSLTFLAGILLIFPGFLSDILGILLLIPPVRRRAIGRIQTTFFGRRFGPDKKKDTEGRPVGGEAPPAADLRDEKTGRTLGEYPGAEKGRDVEFEERRPDGGGGGDREGGLDR